MARLREGRANTARGAAYFLRETVGRVRYAGARGQLTVRADSGFYTHAVVAVCRRMDVRFSITIRQRARLHNLIKAIPEDAWTPIPYWMDGAADVAETTYTPFQAEAAAASGFCPSQISAASGLPTAGCPEGSDTRSREGLSSTAGVHCPSGVQNRVGVKSLRVFRASSLAQASTATTTWAEGADQLVRCGLLQVSEPCSIPRLPLQMEGFVV